jgi:hypothetical protein
MGDVGWIDLKNGVFWDVTPCGWFLQEPHGLASQKTPFFIVTAVKTSNLTWIDLAQEQVESSCEHGNEPSGN